MGHYTTLVIGKQELSWKYDIPSYLSFLFDENDLYTEREPNDDELEKIGFRSTAQKALIKLDKLGFDWEMISDIYAFFYEEIKDSIYYYIHEELLEKFSNFSDNVREKKIHAFYSSIPKFTREQELKDFVNFFLPLVEVCTGEKSMRVVSIDGNTYRLKKEANSSLTNNFIYAPGDFFYNKALVIPPWIQIIGNLFEFDRMQEYPEIISVVQLKLLLEAVDHGTIVELQLEDMIESKEELSDFHAESANRLIQKIQLYNKFFNSVMNQEEVIKNAYFKKELLDLLNEITKITNPAAKGKALEDLIENIFSSIEGLDVVEKRVSTKDEEIDLQVKNGVSGTFWNSLGSPTFFVECKNWQGSIGASEIRDFEMKLINHKKLVKIGFFISFNGFSKEVRSSLIRASREDHHIVLIDRKDLFNLANSKVDSREWLEKLIMKPY
ncbi:restriction endonuclease [Sphingobacterium sp.]|uniref:restriction endonuclease n=1 Tax=Sphingobacterium sp. TaxID=341027 RepID=UPI002FD9A0AC